MGAAKKVLPLEQETKQIELVEVTSSPKPSSKKSRKPRIKSAQKLPAEPVSRSPKTPKTPKPKVAQAKTKPAKPTQKEEKKPQTSAAPKKPVSAVENFAEADVSSVTPQQEESPVQVKIESAPVQDNNIQSETLTKASQPADSQPQTEGKPDAQHAEITGPASPKTDDIPEPEQNSMTDDQALVLAQPMAAKPAHKKIALFIFVAALIVLLGFYVHLNQNIRALTQQVHDLSTIKTTVSTLDTKISTMDTRVSDLETLPAKTRAALLSSILQEMSQKTSYMSTQLETPEQQEKLMRAKELIQQVQTDLNAQY